MFSLPNIDGLNANTVLLASLVLLAFITLVKAWPGLKALAVSESAQLRADRRSDYKELRGEFELLKIQNGVIQRHCTAVDVRMGQLEFIIGLAFDELDRLDEGNPVAKKGREMFMRLYPVPPITAELEELKQQLDGLHSPIPPREDAQ